MVSYVCFVTRGGRWAETHVCKNILRSESTAESLSPGEKNISGHVEKLARVWQSIAWRKKKEKGCMKIYFVKDLAIICTSQTIKPTTRIRKKKKLRIASDNGLVTNDHIS